MTPATWTLLLVAGAIGAPVRYVLDGVVTDRTGGTFPWGTFVINVTGSFVLGFLTGLALYHAYPAAPKLVLGTGFCGAYTTFSTFSFETVRLVEGGARRGALLYVLASLVTGLAAAGLGLAVAAAI
jgi:CrcB protein